MAIVNLTNSETFKIHGNAFEGQALTGGLDIYTITTSLDINPVGIEVDNGTFDPDVFENSASINGAQRFNHLIQLISTRAQPVIIGGISKTTGTTPTYSFTFYIEHPYAWEMSGDLAHPTLAETINGALDFVVGDAIGTDGVNTTVGKVVQLFNDVDPNSPTRSEIE